MRVMRYFTRPTLLGAYRELREAGVPDRHEHPRVETLPLKTKFYIVFAHPWHSQGIVRCLVVWEARGLGWWMDVGLDRWARLPKEEITNPHRFRP